MVKIVFLSVRHETQLFNVLRQCKVFHVYICGSIVCGVGWQAFHRGFERIDYSFTGDILGVSILSKMFTFI